VEFCESLLVVASEVKVEDKLESIYETLASKLAYIYRTFLIKMTAVVEAPWRDSGCRSHGWKDCLVTHKGPLKNAFEKHSGAGSVHIDFGELMSWLTANSVLSSHFSEDHVRIAWDRTRAPAQTTRMRLNSCSAQDYGVMEEHEDDERSFDQFTDLIPALASFYTRNPFETLLAKCYILVVLLIQPAVVKKVKSRKGRASMLMEASSRKLNLK
jgi:hypothetical protein